MISFENFKNQSDDIGEPVFETEVFSDFQKVFDTYLKKPNKKNEKTLFESISQSISFLSERDIEDMAEAIWQKTNDPKLLWKFYGNYASLISEHTAQLILLTLLGAGHDKYIDWNVFKNVYTKIPKWWRLLLATGNKNLLIILFDKDLINKDIADYKPIEGVFDFVCHLISIDAFEKVKEFLPKDFYNDCEAILERMIQAGYDDKVIKIFDIFDNKLPAYLLRWRNDPVVLKVIVGSDKKISWLKGKSDFQVAEIIWASNNFVNKADTFIKIFPNFTLSEYARLYIRSKSEITLPFLIRSMERFALLKFDKEEFLDEVLKSLKSPTKKDYFEDLLGRTMINMSGLMSERSNPFFDFADQLYGDGYHDDKDSKYLLNWLARNIDQFGYEKNKYEIIFKKIIARMDFESFDIKNFASFEQVSNPWFIEHVSNGKGKYDLLRSAFDFLEANRYALNLIRARDSFAPMKIENLARLPDRQILTNEIDRARFGVVSEDESAEAFLLNEFLKNYYYNPDLSIEDIFFELAHFKLISNSKNNDYRFHRKLSLGSNFLNKLPPELCLAYWTDAYQYLEQILNEIGLEERALVIKTPEILTGIAID